MTAALAGVAGSLPSFTLCLYGCHIFTDCGGAPKIAWVGVGGQCHQLNLLQMAVSDAMDELGYESPGNNFLPHVTVGRFDTDDRNWCLEMSDYWCNMPFEATEASWSMKSYCTPANATTGGLLTSFNAGGR